MIQKSLVHLGQGYFGPLCSQIYIIFPIGSYLNNKPCLKSEYGITFTYCMTHYNHCVSSFHIYACQYRLTTDMCDSLFDGREFAKHIGIKCYLLIYFKIVQPQVYKTVYSTTRRCAL